MKDYLERQWSKILGGRVSLADFVFAKEVRLGTYSNKGPAPPAAVVAAKAMAQDPRAEPRFSERVPYVVVHGPPGECCAAAMSLSPFRIPFSRGPLLVAGGEHRHTAGLHVIHQIVSSSDCEPLAVGSSKPYNLGLQVQDWWTWWSRRTLWWKLPGS